MGFRYGAEDRTRTGDLLITNQLHYQLCYFGNNANYTNKLLPLLKNNLVFCIFLMAKKIPQLRDIFYNNPARFFLGKSRWFVSI